MKKEISVGIDRRLQLTWLESTASLYLANTPPKEISRTLRGMLEDKLASRGPEGRGSLEKTITILMRIWVTVPEPLRLFRDSGLKLLQNVPKANAVSIHWGMTMAVYPFWGIVSDITGRLLSLQGSVTIAQILRRVKEQLGERETVIRSAQRAVRSWVDWGLLTNSSEKGIYALGPRIIINDESLAAWLIEATLLASDSKVVPLRVLVNSPAIFPFKINVLPISKLTGRVELHQQGVDEDILILKDTAKQI